MTASPEQNSIISGIGISRIGRRTGIPGLDLTVEASTAAIRDAGLTPGDIDGLATMGETPPDEVRAALGLETSYSGGGFDTGGLLSPLMSAILAVAEGRARHVLVYRTVQMMGGAIPVPPATPNAPAAAAAPPPPPAAPAGAASDAPPLRPGAAGGMMELLTYHAYSAANWLSMHCRRHMHLYGTTNEQLGALVVNSRADAALNPLAVYREPMTLDDYLDARIVSSPSTRPRGGGSVRRRSGEVAAVSTGGGPIAGALLLTS